MVKRGSTTFSATKVVKAGLVASASLQKIIDLKKEVSKLPHHVSVLSKRNHMLQKEVGTGMRVEVVISEVASPERGKKPEQQMVAEPLEKISGLIVAKEEEDMCVTPVAKPGVAESRVAVVVDDMGEASAIGFPVAEGKRRRVNNSSDEGEREDDGGSEEVVVLTCRRGGALEGPRNMLATVVSVRRGHGVLADLFVRRAYRFVDRLLIGMHNGMVDDSYQTRGGSAHAHGRGGLDGGFGGTGYRPYR